MGERKKKRRGGQRTRGICAVAQTLLGMGGHVPLHFSQMAGHGGHRE